MIITRYITTDVSDTDGEDSITLFTEGQKVELTSVRLSNETLSGVEVFVDGGDFGEWICPSLLTSKIPVNEEE